MTQFVIKQKIPLSEKQLNLCKQLQDAKVPHAVETVVTVSTGISRKVIRMGGEGSFDYIDQNLVLSVPEDNNEVKDPKKGITNLNAVRDVIENALPGVYEFDRVDHHEPFVYLMTLSRQI